jgi:hypothetical protein
MSRLPLRAVFDASASVIATGLHEMTHEDALHPHLQREAHRIELAGRLSH